MATSHDLKEVRGANDEYCYCQIALMDRSGRDIPDTYLTQADAAANYATKASVAAGLNYKGSKDTYADLPATGNTIGDMWNVVAAHGTTLAGTNYAWNGTAWDPLGGSIDTSVFVLNTFSINGHPLTGSSIAITKSDVGLGNVTNVSTISSVTQDSVENITSGGVYTALANKQDTLTFDSTPTSGSGNPVTSGGVFVSQNLLLPLSGARSMTNGLHIPFGLSTIPYGLNDTLWSENDVYIRSDATATQKCFEAGYGTGTETAFTNRDAKYEADKISLTTTNHSGTVADETGSATLVDILTAANTTFSAGAGITVQSLHTVGTEPSRTITFSADFKAGATLTVSW